LFTTGVEDNQVARKTKGRQLLRGDPIWPAMPPTVVNIAVAAVAVPAHLQKKARERQKGKHTPSVLKGNPSLKETETKRVREVPVS